MQPYIHPSATCGRTKISGWHTQSFEFLTTVGLLSQPHLKPLSSLFNLQTTYNHFLSQTLFFLSIARLVDHNRSRHAVEQVGRREGYAHLSSRESLPFLLTVSYNTVKYLVRLCPPLLRIQLHPLHPKQSQTKTHCATHRR